MSDSLRRPSLRPVPGTARGSRRIVVDLSDHVDAAPRRRAGVFRRALRREVSRLHDPRRIAAIVAAEPTFALVLSGMIARGEAGRRGRPRVLGGRPDLAQRRRPVPPDRAVPAVRLRAVDAAGLRAVGGAAVGRRLVRLARRDDPAARCGRSTGRTAGGRSTTAVIVAVLAFPFGANLDTGNINLQLTLMLWAAQFTGPRLGGLLWALATWMKWVPVVFWPILPGRAEAVGPVSGSPSRSGSAS